MNRLSAVLLAEKRVMGHTPPHKRTWKGWCLGFLYQSLLRSDYDLLLNNSAPCQSISSQVHKYFFPSFLRRKSGTQLCRKEIVKIEVETSQ